MDNLSPYFTLMTLLIIVFTEVECCTLSEAAVSTLLKTITGKRCMFSRQFYRGMACCLKRFVANPGPEFFFWGGHMLTEEPPQHCPDQSPWSWNQRKPHETACFCIWSVCPKICFFCKTKISSDVFGGNGPLIPLDSSVTLL